MKSQQENSNLTNAQEILDRALLEKLASNILALTPLDLCALQSERQIIAWTREATDGL